MLNIVLAANNAIGKHINTIQYLWKKFTPI